MIKQDIYDKVQSLEAKLQEMSRFVWKHPELGGGEKECADYYRQVLADEGFSIVNNEHLEHAFYAEYGQGKPVIAVLAEYDALPGLSQAVCAFKQPLIQGAAGHGCGHNLLGSAAVTGAIAIKDYLEKACISGTVRLYGCPEEELLSGKVKMIYHHMFDGCDCALSWHPMDASMAHDKAYLANASMKFYFKGKSSHAAFAPDRGRSAWDAVELMNVGSNYLREHVVDRTRIHYSTIGGDFAPNIVPDKAGAYYFVRAPHMKDVQSTVDRVVKIAQGAALMTETEVSVEMGCGCCEFKPNKAFGDLSHANLIEADGPKYTKEELSFAKELQETLDPAVKNGMKNAYQMYDPAMFMGVGARDLWVDNEMSASSDTGDVSFLIPTGLFTTACWPVGVSPHTWQASSCAGTTIGEKGALYAAKVIAGMAYDLYNKPEVLAKIVKEFDANTTGEYVPMYEE